MGSGSAGRLAQTRQEWKSPSAVPASPPLTMVIASVLAQACAMPVPIEVVYCVSIVGETGTTLNSGIA